MLNNTTGKLAAKSRLWETLGHITIQPHFLNKKLFKRERKKMGKETEGRPIDRNPEALGVRIPHSTFHNLNINIPSVCCLVQAMKMRDA